VQVCARLGISLVHAQPYSAASKGKIERFNGTISRMFYPLVEDFTSLSIDQLNRQFSTFVNDIYHTKVHFYQQPWSISPGKISDRFIENHHQAHGAWTRIN
jgi:hypothetical protein